MADWFRELLRVFARHPVVVPGALMVALWWHVAPDVATLPEISQAVHQATAMYGAAYLLAWLPWRTAFTPNATVSLGNVLAAWAGRAVCIAMLLVALRTFGVELAELIAWVKANPDATLAVVTAAVLVRIVGAWAPSPDTAIESNLFTPAARPRARAQSPQELRRTAVHEAGHALMWGLCSNRPTTLSVRVLAEVSPTDPWRGYVHHATDEDTVFTESRLRWSMLMHLAGSEAEHVALGERADGSASDNAKWLRDATLFLVSGFGEVFYGEPDGEAQCAYNRVVLNDLKSDCVSAVREFLAVNRAVLDDLSSALEVRKSLDSEQLAAYLNRVVGTSRVPRPAWAQSRSTSAAAGS